MNFSNMQHQSALDKIGILEVLGFLTDGLKLALSKECRAFVIIPIIINFLVLGTGAYFAHQAITGFLDSYLNELPEFLHFLSYVLSVVVMLSLGLAFCFVFSIFATIIASPFYGLLAEKVELLLFNTKGNDDGIIDIIKDVPRILKRELRKQIFYLPRALLCLIVFFIPVVNVLFTPLWFLLSSYMAALQYSDYGFDNHKVPFPLMRQALRRSPLSTFLLGAVITLLLTIPILNLIVPPCAVCAGTIYYVRLRQIAPDLPLKREVKES